MPDTGYSRSPKLIKGALIHFSAPMLVPVPNVIVFQYNPETMTRSLEPWKPKEAVVYENEDAARKALPAVINELSQPFDPNETFSLTLELDAADALEQPDQFPLNSLVGVADRISALELLCYPPGRGAIGGLLGVSVNVSLTGGLRTGLPEHILRQDVPIVLFFWGPGRIVPVRVSTFSVEEQQYSPTLYPLRAKVTLGLTVLNETHLLNVQGFSEGTASVELAKACYKFTQAQKEALATAALAKTFDAMGLLPF